MSHAVRLAVGHSFLRETLARMLGEGARWRVVGERERARVIITTTRDSSPETCRRMIRQGVRIIALAALPSEAEARAYRALGLTYLAMNELADLRDALRSAAP